MHRPSFLLFSLLSLAAIGDARAVVVSGGDGTQNTTAPADDFGLANVGRVYNTANQFFNSGVYLGNGWVLSAYHVVRDPNNSSGFLFGDVVFNDPVLGPATFAVNPSTAIRLQNSDSTFADLALFQLTTVPTFLSAVSIASTLPTGGSAVTMAGNGVNRQPGLTYWNISNGNYTEGSPPGDASGYKEIQGSQTIRWGTNTMEPGTTTQDIGFGRTTFFTTDFDNTPGEAQAAAGDSGGAVFHKNGNAWELVGILDATDGPLTQPDFTAVYGNTTVAVSLPTYRSQIVATIIPEPGSLSLGLAGAVVLGWRRRRATRP